MALKDWKKTSSGENYTVWINEKLNYNIVLNSGFAENRHTIFIKGFSDTFKTKSQALKFAKSYMRSH